QRGCAHFSVVSGIKIPPYEKQVRKKRRGEGDQGDAAKEKEMLRTNSSFISASPCLRVSSFLLLFLAVPRAALLTAARFFVHGCPRAALGLLLGHATIFVAF